MNTLFYKFIIEANRVLNGDRTNINEEFSVYADLCPVFNGITLRGGVRVTTDVRLHCVRTYKSTDVHLYGINF